MLLQCDVSGKNCYQKIGPVTTPVHGLGMHGSPAVTFDIGKLSYFVITSVVFFRKGEKGIFLLLRMDERKQKQKESVHILTCLKL